MGCINSKNHMRLTRTKGGSMIMAKNKQPEEEEQYEKGNVILSPDVNSYRVGNRIVRPVDIKESFYVDVQMPTDALSVLCAYKSLRGRSAAPPHKPNQDSLSVFNLKDRPDVAVFSVFDGHGPFGEYASHFCRNELHPAMAEAPSLKYDVKKTLEEGLATCHGKFIKTSPSCGVDPLVSGTTAITVALEGNHLFCANVGDSRAILGTKQDDGSILAKELSDDHKPQRPDEKARIKKSSAILMTERNVRTLDRQTPSDKVYVCREKHGDIIYGVLFTRSLGDKDAHEHLGVSALPEFREHDLQLMDQYVVLASDGVWDHMTNEEAVEMCFAKDDPLLACEQIVRVSAERWENQDFDHRRDDITVMVLKIQPDKRPKEPAPVKEEDVTVDS